MKIPIYNFLNHYFNYNNINLKNFNFKKKLSLNFNEVKKDEFPIYSLFQELDKNLPQNIIKFNVANEHAVNLFKNKQIKYTDIYKIINKILSFNLNSEVNSIKDIIHYHNDLELYVKENSFKFF